MISFNMLTCMDILFTKTSFFSTIFKRNNAIFFIIFKKKTMWFFHNWSGTGPLHNFGEKNAEVYCDIDDLLSSYLINAKTFTLHPTKSPRIVWHCTLILRRIGILMSLTIISLMQVSLGNILFSIKIWYVRQVFPLQSFDLFVA